MKSTRVVVWLLQGFASGDCERDAQAINIFMEDGHALGCSQSYAKNMGLYGQRIGCFSIVTEDPKEAVKVESQMKVCPQLVLVLHSPLLGNMINGFCCCQIVEPVKRHYNLRWRNDQCFGSHACRCRINQALFGETIHEGILQNSLSAVCVQSLASGCAML